MGVNDHGREACEGQDERGRRMEMNKMSKGWVQRRKKRNEGEAANRDGSGRKGGARKTMQIVFIY